MIKLNRAVNVHKGWRGTLFTQKSSVNSYNLAIAAANLLADISGCSLLLILVVIKTDCSQDF